MGAGYEDEISLTCYDRPETTGFYGWGLKDSRTQGLKNTRTQEHKYTSIKVYRDAGSRVRYQVSAIKGVADGENGPFMSSSEAVAGRECGDTGMQV